MKTNHRFLVFLLALVTTASAFGQTATFSTVANEKDTVTFTTAANYSFGSLTGTTIAGVVCSAATRNCFAPTGAAKAGASLVAANGTADATDPSNGVAKILQVLQTSVVQTGTVRSNATGAVTNWSVPALTVTVAAIPALTLTITGATITTPITLKLGGPLGWCSFVNANDSGNYGITLSGCLTPPPAR
jgi:hypothetical protein